MTDSNSENTVVFGRNEALDDIALEIAHLRTIEAINWMAYECYRCSAEHGFWDLPVIGGQLIPRNKGEMIALIHSELSEALEAVRHGNPPSEHIPDFSGEEEEMADAVIRIMDYCAGHGLRLGEAIHAKYHFNVNRPKMHGKKF